MHTLLSRLFRDVICNATLHRHHIRHFCKQNERIKSNAHSIKKAVLSLSKKDKNGANRAIERLVSKAIKTKSPGDVINLVYYCSQTDLPIDNRHFGTFGKFLRKHNKGINASSISRLLYGLRFKDDKSFETRQLLKTICYIVDKNNIVLDFSQHMTMGIYCLRGMSCDTEEVRLWLSKLTSMMSSPNLTFHSRAIATILNGLQGMRSDCVEVLGFLEQLSRKVPSDKTQMGSREIGALHSLQGMSSDHREVRSLVKSLATSISSASFATLKGQAIASAFDGLQRMNSNYPEVRELLKALLKLLPKIDNKMNNLEISSSFYGLQEMSSFHSEVRAVVSVLTGYIVDCPQPFSAKNISFLLYGCQNMHSIHIEVRSMLTALSSKIVECKEPFNSNQVGIALFGLQKMSSEEVSVKRVVFALTEKVASCSESLNSRSIAYSLFGLQRLNSEHMRVRALLAVLASKIRESSDVFNTSTVGFAFSGLQNMSSKHYEVQQLLKVLTPKVQECNTLSGISIARVLNGLGKMSSSEDCVKELLVVLLDKLIGCNDTFSKNDVENALSGLRLMSSEHSEVLAFLSVLSEKVMGCHQELQPKQLSKMLFGMQGMDSKHPEVRKMLRAVEMKLANCNQDFREGEIGVACYGLQSMSNSDTHVANIVHILTQKMAKLNTTNFSARHISLCFVGMQRMTWDSPEVRSMLHVLSGKLIERNDSLGGSELSNILYGLITGFRTAKDESEKLIALVLQEMNSSLDSYSQFDMNEFYRTLSLLHFYCKDDLSAPLSEQIVSLLDSLAQSIKHHKDISLSSSITGLLSEYGSTSESSITGVVMKYCLDNNIKVSISRNENLHGFEADIIIRQDKKIVNIEVDGPLHQYPKRILFTNRRDEYLTQQHGCVVARLDITAFRKKKWRDAEKAVQGLLKDIL